MVHAPAHGRPSRKSKRGKRFLIFCGAEVTEIEYFEYVKSVVKRHCAASWDVQHALDIKGKGIDPLTLTEEAIALMHRDAKTARKEQYEPYSQIWVVTDVDDFSRKIQQAHGKAGSTSGKVQLVISNPCFEVWLIDHVVSCPAAYTQTRPCQQYAKELGLLGNTTGRKNKHLMLDAITGRYASAVKNAGQHMRDPEQQALRRNRPSAVKNASYAPWTDIPQITATLINECKRMCGTDITGEL